MTLKEIDVKLNEIQTSIAQWIEQGYTPTIEKQNVLYKLQTVYDTLSNGKSVKSEKPIVETIEEQSLIIPTQIIGQQRETMKTVAELVIPKQETPTMVLILGQKISVAQRAIFVSELFWKDEAFFANEIRKFQEIKSLDEALIYIGEKYNWAANNVYAEQFIAILENYYK